MEVINVGEVEVEEVIDFLLSNDNLKNLSSSGSVPCFVLAHEIILPDFYKLLIENSPSIDATTRNFIDFIIFYGNNTAINKDEIIRGYSQRSSLIIKGLSKSKKDIYLPNGISFDKVLTHEIINEKQNINLKHLSNYMTRGALALMQRYSLNETSIPSVLFINPENPDEFLIKKIDVNNPTTYLYKKILEPLSICFHEIEEYNFNKIMITLESEKVGSAEDTIEKFDRFSPQFIREKINGQIEKFSNAGLLAFIDRNENYFHIIRHVLSSVDVINEIKRDVFICHASEDKNPYVNDLYNHLDTNGIKCWFDSTEISWGDSIVNKVNEGLRVSRYVLVVLSTNSIEKNWPKTELEASLNMEISTGATKVLPLLLGNEEEIKKIMDYYPILASKLFVKYSDGLDKIASLLKERLSK